MGQHLKIMEVKSFPQIMTWVESFSHSDKDMKLRTFLTRLSKTEPEAGTERELH